MTAVIESAERFESASAGARAAGRVRTGAPVGPGYRNPGYREGERDRRGERRGAAGAGRRTRPTNRRDAGPLQVVGGRGVAAACAPRARSRSVRVLVGLGVLSALAVLVLAVVHAAGAGSTVPERTAVVQVQDGQTLSAVAASAAPDADRGAVVERIRELNGLSTSALRAGESLVVPASE